MDEKLKNSKDQFEKSIPTSFTEQDKQAVMNQIKQRKPNRNRKFLPIASSVAALAIATLFVIFMFNNDKFERSATQNDNSANSAKENEMDEMDNDADAESGSDADITGYIMDINEDVMLVIAKDPKDFSSDGGINEFYSAIEFSNVPDDVEVGEYVHVWAQDGINESYPGQATVGGLEKAEVYQPEDALLTEAEAIQKAIDYGKETGEFVNNATAIREINFHRYSRENATWSIDFYDTVEENAFQIEIQDQQPSAVTLSPYDTYMSPRMYSPFDMETIEVDETIGSFVATDVQRSDESTSITLAAPGDPHWLSGDIIRDDDEWRFKMEKTHFENIGLFPFAENDVGERVQFKLVGDGAIQELYVVDREDSIIENVEIDIEKIEYDHSSTGSVITLYLYNHDKDVQTSIKTGDSSIPIYEEYSKTLDDQFLTNLDPMDIFDIYMYAASIGDFETTYALYADEQTTSILNEAGYIEEQKEKDENNFINLNEDLGDVENFTIYTDNSTATIRYKVKNDYKVSFHLIKGKTNNIWKVKYHPLLLNGIPD